MTPAVALCKSLLVYTSNMLSSSSSADLGDTHNKTLTWKADIPAGTQVVLSLEDATGEEAWSGTVSPCAYMLPKLSRRDAAVDYHQRQRRQVLPCLQLGQ